MTSMERLDCASVIQSYLSTTPHSSPAVVHNHVWENQHLELDEKL